MGRTYAKNHTNSSSPQRAVTLRDGERPGGKMQSVPKATTMQFHMRGFIARTLLLMVIAVISTVLLIFPTVSQAKITRLTNDGSSSMRVGVGWSPDGKHILFIKVFGDNGEIMQLWIMDADGRNAKPISGRGWQQCYGWSPDSKKIVFAHCPDCSETSPGTFLLYDLASGCLKTLRTGFLQMAADDPSGWGVVQWTKDSKAFVIGMGKTNDLEPKRNVFLYDIKSGKVKSLTPNLCQAGGMYAGSWSPDSSFLAMQAKKSANDRFRVWICKRDGSNLHPITPADWQVYGDPRWSPAANLIVFSTNHGRLPEEKRNDECDLWLVRPDGTGLRRLTHGSSPNVNDRMDFGYPEWSADGKYVSCISNRFDKFGNQYPGIALVDVETGERIPVIDNDPKSDKIFKGFELKNANLATNGHIAFVAERYAISKRETGNPKCDYEKDFLYSYDIKARKRSVIDSCVEHMGGMMLYAGGFYGRAFWSPDESKLLFQKFRLLPGNNASCDYESDLYLYEP
jgi:Tol biopolymer transport system component